MKKFKKGQTVNVIQYFGLSRVAYRATILEIYDKGNTYWVEAESGGKTYVKYIDLMDAN